MNNVFISAIVSKSLLIVLGTLPRTHPKRRALPARREPRAPAFGHAADRDGCSRREAYTVSMAWYYPPLRSLKRACWQCPLGTHDVGLLSFAHPIPDHAAANYVRLQVA